MICPNSFDGTRHFIPDGCVICTEERSRIALREFQKRPLRLIAQGKGVLTTRLIGTVRHVQQFSAERTFCSRKVESYHRRGTTTFNAYVQATDRVCEQCKTEVVALAAEGELCSA
jgi:hypothetical protein